MNTKKVILLAILAEAAVAALAVSNYGLTLEGLQATTRFSGRLSLFLFTFIFLFHRSAVDISRWFSKDYFLVFAVAHGIHLLELLSYVYLSGTLLIPLRLAGGFMAYVFIFLMPWLNNRFQRNLITEKKFNTIGLVYLYYVWFIFFFTYLSRVQGKLPNAGGSYGEHVVLLGWVSLMLGMRIQRFTSLTR